MKRFHALLVAATLVVLLIAKLRAQDITVGEISSCVAADAPSQLPRIRGAWSVPVPAELQGASRAEVVFVQMRVKPDGEFDHGIRGTDTKLNHAMGATVRNLKLDPARRDGQTVDAYVWLPLVFNPAGAAANTPDASPRIIHAAPFLAPAALFAQLKLGETAKSPLRVSVEIDAAGALQRVTPPAACPAPLVPLIEKTLRDWRFSAARAGGNPVAAKLEVPVQFFSDRVLVPPRPEEMIPEVRARPTRQVAPNYPASLNKLGISGRVVVRFVVDVQGRVQNPEVVQTDSTEFNAAALDAVRAWRFEPAQTRGKPVPSIVQLPLMFTPRSR